MFTVEVLCPVRMRSPETVECRDVGMGNGNEIDGEIPEC